MHVFSKKQKVALVFMMLVGAWAFADESKRGGILDDLENYHPYRAPDFDSNYKAETLPTDKGMAEKCRDLFIRDDGTYGDVGNMIKAEITQSRIHDKSDKFTKYSEALPENFFEKDPGKIEDVCKDFKNFSPDQKLNFWVYVMAAVAQNESGCDPDVKPNTAAANGTAIGLFQTPLLENGKKPTWRGKGCTEPPAYQSVESQVACGMEIMSDLLDGNLCGEKKKVSDYTAFDDDSYWATLRPNNKEQGAAKIAKKQDTLSIIKVFPPCHN